MICCEFSRIAKRASRNIETLFFFVAFQGKVRCAAKLIVCYNLNDFAGHPPEIHGYAKKDSVKKGQ